MVIGCSASKIFASSQQSSRNKSINSPLHWSKSYSPEKSVGLSPTSDGLQKSNKSNFEASSSLSSENKSHKMRHRKKSSERKEEKIATRHLLVWTPKDSLNSISKVEKFFSKYGFVEEVKKLEKKGQYIVSFEDVECAEKVFDKRKLNYNGEDIEVEYCYPDKSYTSSPALLSEINTNGKANGYEEFESNNESKHNDHHSKSRVHRSTSHSPKNAESHRNVLKDKSHNKMSHSENIPTTSKLIGEPLSPTPPLQDCESLDFIKEKLNKDVKELYDTTPMLKNYKYADIFCHSASRILYVTFSHSTIIDNEVKRQFLQFGAILDISVVKFPNNAYALIEYDSMRAVAEVIEFFNECFNKKQSEICKKYEPFKISLSKANWGRHLITNILWLEFLPSGTTWKYLFSKLKEAFKETLIEVHFHGVNREAVIVFDSNESATNAFNAFKQSNVILNPTNKDGFVRTACDYSSPKNLERFICSVNKLHNTIKEDNDIVIGNDDNLITFNLIQVTTPTTTPTDLQPQPLDSFNKTETYPISSEDETTTIIKKESKPKKSSSISPCVTLSPVSSIEESESNKKEKSKRNSSTKSSKVDDKKNEKSQNLLKRKLSKCSNDESEYKEHKKSIKKCKIIGGAVPVSPVSRSSKDNTPKPCTSDSEDSVISSRSKPSISRHERKSRSKRREQRNSYDKHSTSHVSNAPLSSQYFGESSRTHYESSSSRRRRHYNDPHHSDFGRHRDYGNYKNSRDDYRSYDRKENNDRSIYKDDRKYNRDDRGESHDKEQNKNQDEKNKKRDRKSKKHKKQKEKHHIRDDSKEIQDHKKSHDHTRNNSNKINEKHLNHKSHDSTSNNLHDSTSDKVTKSHGNTLKNDKRPPLNKSHHHITDKCKENVKSDKTKPTLKKGGQTSISGAEEISDTDEEEQHIENKKEGLSKCDENFDNTPIEDDKKHEKEPGLIENILLNENEDIPLPPEDSPPISKDYENKSSSPTPSYVQYTDEVEPTHVHPYTADRLLVDCMNITNIEEKQYTIPNFVSPTTTSDCINESQEIIDDDNNVEYVHEIPEDDVNEDTIRHEHAKTETVEINESQSLPTEVEIHDEFGYLIYKGRKNERIITYVELPPLSPIPEYHLSTECKKIYESIKNELEDDFDYKNNTYDIKLNNRGIKKVDMNPNSRYNAEEVSELLRGRETKYEGTLDNLDGAEVVHENEEETYEEVVEEVEQLNPDGTKKKKMLPRFHPIKNKALAFKMYGKFISDSSAYRQKFVTFMNTFSDLFDGEHDDVLNDVNMYEGDIDNDSLPSICNFNNQCDVDSVIISDEEYNNDQNDKSTKINIMIEDNLLIENKRKTSEDNVIDDINDSNEENNEQIPDEDIFEHDIYEHIQMEEEFNNENYETVSSHDNENSFPLHLSNNETSEKCQQDIPLDTFSGYDINNDFKKYTTDEVFDEVNDNNIDENCSKKELIDDDEICSLPSSSELNEIVEDENTLDSIDYSLKIPNYNTNTVNVEDLYQSFINESPEETINKEKILRKMSGSNNEKLTLIFPYYFESKKFKNIIGIEDESNNDSIDKLSSIGVASNDSMIAILQGDIEYKYMDNNDEIREITRNEFEKYYHKINDDYDNDSNKLESNMQINFDTAQDRVSSCGYVKYLNNQELENYLSGNEKHFSPSNERYYSNTNDKIYSNSSGQNFSDVIVKSQSNSNDKYYSYSSEENSQEICELDEQSDEVYHDAEDYLLKEQLYESTNDQTLVNTSNNTTLVNEIDYEKSYEQMDEEESEELGNVHRKEVSNSIENKENNDELIENKEELENEGIIDQQIEEYNEVLIEEYNSYQKEQCNTNEEVEIKEEYEGSEVDGNHDEKCMNYYKMVMNQEYEVDEINDEYNELSNEIENNYGNYYNSEEDEEINQYSHDEINSNDDDNNNISSDESNEHDHLPNILGIQGPPKIFISNIDANIGLALNIVTDEFDGCKEYDGAEINVLPISINEDDYDNDSYGGDSYNIGENEKKKEEGEEGEEGEEEQEEEKDDDDDVEEPDGKLLPNHADEINDIMDNNGLIYLLQNTYKRNYDGIGDDILYNEPLYKRKKLEIIPASHSELEIENIVSDEGDNILSVSVKNYNIIEENDSDDKESNCENDSITSSEYHTSDLEYLSAEENIFNFDHKYLESRCMKLENMTIGDMFSETSSHDDNSCNSLYCHDSHLSIHPSSMMDLSNGMSPDEADGMEVDLEFNKTINVTTISNNTNAVDSVTTSEPNKNIEIPSLAMFTTKNANINEMVNVPIDRKCIKRYYVKTRLENDDSDSEEVNYENYEIFIKDLNHMEELKKYNTVVEDKEVIGGDGFIRPRTNNDLHEYLARRQRIVANYTTNNYDNSTLSNINDDGKDNSTVYSVEKNLNEVIEKDNKEAKKKHIIENTNLVAKENGNTCIQISKKESNLELMLIDEAPDKEAIEALNSLSHLDERDIVDESIDDTSFLLDDIENPSDFCDSLGSELLEEEVEKLLCDDVPSSPKKIKTEYVEESVDKNTLVNGYVGKEKIVSLQATEIDNKLKEPEMNVEDIVIKEEYIQEERNNDMVVVDEIVKENEKENMVKETEDEDEKELNEDEENMTIEGTFSIKTDNHTSSPIQPLANNITENVLSSSLKNTISENEENIHQCDMENNKNSEKDECKGKENIIVQQNGYTSLPLSNKANNYKLYVNTFGITFVNGTVLFELANANCLTSCPRICLQLKKWLCKLNLFYISGMKEILNDFIVTHTHPNRLNPKNRNIIISKKIVSKEYYENIKKHLLNSSPNVLNLICGASGYNKEDYELEETRLNNILTYCKKNGLYSGLLWQNAVSDYVAFFIPSCDILDDQFKSAQPQAFCKVKTGSMSYFYISIAPANLFRSGSS